MEGKNDCRFAGGIFSGVWFTRIGDDQVQAAICRHRKRDIVVLKIGEAPVLPDGVKVAVPAVHGEGRIGRIEHELSCFGVNYQRFAVGS
jgi:hypothetical protein